MTAFADLEAPLVLCRAARRCGKPSSGEDSCATDDGAKFDMTVELQAEKIAPQVTWGTKQPEPPVKPGLSDRTTSPAKQAG